jgi:hypothetical protein
MSTRRTRRPAQRTDPAGGEFSPPTLASVTPHPTQVKAAPKRSTKPKALVKAVDGTERDVLVALRCKLAARLDADVPNHAFGELVRQFREVDSQIRVMDVRERAAAEAEAADADDDGEDGPAWDDDAI